MKALNVSRLYLVATMILGLFVAWTASMGASNLSFSRGGRIELGCCDGMKINSCIGDSSCTGPENIHVLCDSAPEYTTGEETCTAPVHPDACHAVNEDCDYNEYDEDCEYQ